MKGVEPQNRPITAEERALIEWLLQHGVEGAQNFLPQLNSLTVSSKCVCGCPSVLFSFDGEPVIHGTETILADMLGTVDGIDIGIMLFQRGERLSMLDVYSWAGQDKPFGLPKIEAVYPWEQLTERQKIPTFRWK